MFKSFVMSSSCKLILRLKKTIYCAALRQVKVYMSMKAESDSEPRWLNFFIPGSNSLPPVRTFRKVFLSLSAADRNVLPDVNNQKTASVSL